MEHTIDITGKNTLRVLETATGVVLILKESERIKPKKGDKYYYVAFNAIRGFFCWEMIWRDSDVDNALYFSGNCFIEPSEPNEISSEFNQRFLIRTK